MSVLNSMAVTLGAHLTGAEAAPRLEAGVVPELLGLGLEPVKDATGFEFFYVVAETWKPVLEFLAGSRPAKAAELSFEHCLRVVNAVLTEWEAYVARGNRPCPGCRAPVDLHELTAHLMVCEAHPEHRRAERMEEVLSRVRGPKLSLAGRMLRDRDRKHFAIVRLVGASHAYRNGFSDDIGHASISETGDQRWKAARAEATVQLNSLPIEL